VVLTETAARQLAKFVPCANPDRAEALLRRVLELGFRIRADYSDSGLKLKFDPPRDSKQRHQLTNRFPPLVTLGSTGEQIRADEVMLDNFRSLAAIFHLFLDDVGEDLIWQSTRTDGATVGSFLYGVTSETAELLALRHRSALARRILEHKDVLGPTFKEKDILEAEWALEREHREFRVREALQFLQDHYCIGRVASSAETEESTYCFEPPLQPLPDYTT